jgi:MoaE-MoaD fusion protein
VQVEVRMFGGLTERVGASTITVELSDDATVADLRAAVAAAHPNVAPLLPGVNVAVDLEVARPATPLAGAREIAMLPPVAGGAADGPPPAASVSSQGSGVARPAAPDERVVTGLRTPPFDVDAVVAQVTGPAVGGTAIFLGTVRDHAPDLDDVVGLEYSAYPEMAEKVLAQLALDLRRDHPSVSGIALLHAVGDLDVGDHTVLIVCASAHRSEAFDACRDALERVKDDVPIWKRELTAGGDHRWVGLNAPDAAGDAQVAAAPDARADAPSHAAPGVRALDAVAAAPLLDDPAVVVLDIRTDAELAQARLPRAVQLDYYAPDFAHRLAALDRDTTYLLYCRSGQRSGEARGMMARLGFRDVVDLRGGIVQWSNAGLPLEG